MKKISYILGVNVGSNLVNSGVEDLDLDEFIAGVKTVLNDEMPKISMDDGNKLFDEYMEKLNKKREEKVKKELEEVKQKSEEYLKENAKKEGVITTKSGLQYRVIKEGEGNNPTSHSKVKCNYEGKLVNGEVFDSSYKRGEPAEFWLNQVIPGWVEGLQLMKPGAEYEFTIPANLAYGENGVRGAIPPFATLIFKVELLEIS